MCPLVLINNVFLIKNPKVIKIKYHSKISQSFLVRIAAIIRL